MSDEQTGLGPQTVFAAVGAVTFPILVIVARANHIVLGNAVLFGAGLIAAALIVVVLRAPVPGWVRAGLGLLVFAGMIGLLLGRDLFGTNLAGSQLAVVIATASPTPTPNPAAGSSGGNPWDHGTPDGVHGASVALKPSPGGDNGWAGTLQSAYDGTLGGTGAAAIRIQGEVAATQAAGNDQVAMIWTITYGGTTAGCGRSTAIAPDHGDIVSGLQKPLETAIGASLRARHGACY
jgi:hypothetical protein